MIKEYCDKFYECFKEGCKISAGRGSNNFDDNLHRLNEYILDENQDEEEYARFAKYLSEKDADFFEKYINEKLSKEGFASYEVRRVPKQQYRTDFEYVEYSSGEKLLGGILGIMGADIGDKDGYQKKVNVKDGFRYDMRISVNW